MQTMIKVQNVPLEGILSCGGIQARSRVPWLLPPHGLINGTQELRLQNALLDLWACAGLQV